MIGIQFVALLIFMFLILGIAGYEYSKHLLVLKPLVLRMFVSMILCLLVAAGVASAFNQDSQIAVLVLAATVGAAASYVWHKLTFR